ncbi:MAG: MBL fold metallo-hydrolase [Dehalococcoidia bacterium]
MKINFQGVPDEIYVLQIPTPSLGDHTYLVVVDGEAAVVDPQLDLDRFEKLIVESNVRLRWVLDTHVHNDYVSGAKILAERYGAAYVLPLDSGATFEHSVIRNDDSIPIGRCQLRAIHTPGHTPHHMSYVLESTGESDINGKTIAVFSGGSMLVGAVGRTDLLGPELAEELAYDQFRSVNQLAEQLPDPTTVGPTHGSGSFCSATPTGNDTVSTIGLERTRNPALISKNADSFVSEQLAGYGLYPSYYAHMGPLNREGSASSELVSPPNLSPHEVTDHATDSVLVDLRGSKKFADGHISGSINVPMSQAAGAYIAWVLRWDSNLILISDQQRVIDDILLQLHRIGMTKIQGVVSDGLQAWKSEGRQLSNYRVATFKELKMEKPENIVDARDPLEFNARALACAVNIHFSQISSGVSSLNPGTIWVHCQSGYRASIAASKLARSGRDVVLVNDDFWNVLN